MPKSNQMEIITDIVLYDVIGYSQKSSEDQLRIACLMTNTIKEVVGLLRGLGGMWVKELDSDPLVLGYIPTGDGAYIILNPIFAGYGIFLALSLRNHLVMVNKRAGGGIYSGVRFAVVLGEIYPYMDIMGRINYAGDGMNHCGRIGSAHKSENFPASFTDENYVVSEENANNWFQEKVIGTIRNDYKDIFKVKSSSMFVVEDKHGRKHKCFLHEMNRFLALEPIKPTVTLDDTLRQQLRDLAFGKLP